MTWQGGKGTGVAQELSKESTLPVSRGCVADIPLLGGDGYGSKLPLALVP